jgi:hypothetical protein
MERKNRSGYIAKPQPGVWFTISLGDHQRNLLSAIGPGRAFETWQLLAGERSHCDAGHKSLTLDLPKVMESSTEGGHLLAEQV